MKFNHTAHKELWNWLAENPDEEKEDWPGWQVNGGKHGECENNCFACEYALSEGHNFEYAPCALIWRDHDERFEDDTMRCHINCEYLNSEFGLWERCDVSEEERAALARQIANLPVREGVECE